MNGRRFAFAGSGLLGYARERMYTLKLTLEYDGSKFSGWQDQINARTVQGELKKAALELFREEADIQGAGRTDAGVHALGQVAHIKLRGKAPRLHPQQILRELNDKLPSSIAITEIEQAAPRFHARHDAVSRAYFYQISTRKAALSKKFVWWIKEPLDVSRMQAAAALLPGRHDFLPFRTQDPSKPEDSTIVVVESAEVAVDDHMIVFRIQASHYLWKMVRRVTGVLVKAGLGEVSLDEFKELLSGKVNPKLNIAAWTAPAAGLFLEEIRY
jgi:tRNA pseudouridine38-40 synthase